MLKREDLSREHDELNMLATEILNHVDAAAPDFQALSNLRWRMSRVLLIHLAKEDRLLYPELRRSMQPGVSGLATRFADEMGGLALAFTDYVTNWPVQRAMADWRGFRRSTRAILTDLSDRIRREEQELYPLVS